MYSQKQIYCLASNVLSAQTDAQCSFNKENGNMTLVRDYEHSLIHIWWVLAISVQVQVESCLIVCVLKNCPVSHCGFLICLKHFEI